MRGVRKRGWMRRGKGGRESGGVSMTAVAVATSFDQAVQGGECGRLCEGQGSGVPSSLVWVSVPASGSASSNAPGSLNGLSLQGEEKEEKPSIQYGNKGRKTHAQRETRLLVRV